jgi:hypothetical protein
MYLISFKGVMCYSKEVQLATSLILLISALIYYLYNFRRSSLKESWQKSFLNMIVLVFLCIGLHQFFEFLSLLTNNNLIYKLGLIISILGTYFLLRSLEVLSHKNYYSLVAIIPIGLVSLHILFSNMIFSEAGFYLRHHSAFFWAAAWIFLFIYWHFCAFKTFSEIKDDASRKTLLLYLLAIADFSFILSIIYVLVGYFMFSVNVCTDSPSIWCTFSVVQSFLIPWVMIRLGHHFKRPTISKKMSINQLVTYLISSLIILIILTLTLPFFNCLSWKFIFP